MEERKRARQVVLRKRPGVNGVPTPSCFGVEEYDLEEGDFSKGEILVRVICLSVDPYMRCRMNEDTGADYMAPWKLGEAPVGGGVAKVIVSQSESYPAGCFVESFSMPWRTVTPVPIRGLRPVPDGSADHLGVLGLTGLTSYCGMVFVGDLLAQGRGKTLVVSGAAGACGHVAGQLGKIFGMTVIGIAGREDKLAWLSELGFDGVINYKTENVRERVAALAPAGVDVYFDNVGAEVSDAVIWNMAQDGHILLCGQIATYNSD
eukprot:CAMPEP_0119152402 /NCGR_PEP_ID=MMETSP1310-20130426/47749_1 /TAXON_ID=464262 /ORGANISM="Genus nov. species nov., Strain RCC2339" /LENGTH=261 /DNA_ID=CAMNT_0007144759 /DNA_START=142 /DNA_END=924 /DNA_ORIENTATION=+